MDSLWIFALGFLAQLLFAARTLVQWILSEKSRKVVSPTVFWIISLVASLLFFLYGWLRRDFALMLGQVIGYYVYIWNLHIKGTWRTMGNWRYPLTGILLSIPLAAMGGMAFHWDLVTASLFHNEAIPRWLIVFGTAGQVIFSLRFLYQAFYSSRRHASILPGGFWFISLTGATFILVYGIFRQDPVLILSQSFGIVTYIRNLMLWGRMQHD